MPVAVRRKPPTTEVAQLPDAVVDYNAAVLHDATVEIMDRIKRASDDPATDTNKVPFGMLNEATKQRYRELVRLLVARGLWNLNLRAETVPTAQG